MTNKERIQANNAELLDLIDMAENLPDVGEGGTPTPTQEKNVEITTNGTHEVTPDDGYALSKVTANVNVPTPDPVLISLNVTANGTYDPPDGIDGFNPVSVNVPIPDGYIKPAGSVEITENGEFDVTGAEKVIVNVEQSAGDSESTNTQWFADYMMDISPIEVYNDKADGTLGAYAFYENGAVTRIELPNIQYLKERCFYGCENLTTLLLPGLVGYTYQYMASGCTSLVDVDIHDASFVSSYTFQNCSSLKKVDLHKVGTIATYAFSGCTKLDTLIIRTDTVPTLSGTNAFQNTKIKSGGTGYVYVKAAMLDQFVEATNWSSLQFRTIEDYPDITGG